MFVVSTVRRYNNEALRLWGLNLIHKMDQAQVEPKLAQVDLKTGSRFLGSTFDPPMNMDHILGQIRLIFLHLIQKSQFKLTL